VNTLCRLGLGIFFRRGELVSCFLSIPPTTSGGGGIAARFMRVGLEGAVGLQTCEFPCGGLDKLLGDDEGMSAILLHRFSLYYICKTLFLATRHVKTAQLPVAET